MKKLLVVGVILLFLGSSIPVLALSSENSQDNLIITHIPPDGLYWGSTKISNFSKPVWVCGGKFVAYEGFNVSGQNINRVQAWWNGVEAFNSTLPPFGMSFVSSTVLRPFSHSPPWSIKVTFNDGTVVWDNWSIWRLF